MSHTASKYTGQGVEGNWYQAGSTGATGVDTPAHLLSAYMMSKRMTAGDFLPQYGFSKDSKRGFDNAWAQINNNPDLYNRILSGIGQDAGSLQASLQSTRTTPGSGVTAAMRANDPAAAAAQYARIDPQKRSVVAQQNALQNSLGTKSPTPATLTPSQITQYFAQQGKAANPLSPLAWLAQQMGTSAPTQPIPSSPTNSTVAQLGALHNQSAAPASNTPPKTQNTSDQYLQAYLDSLRPSSQENQYQSQLDALTSQQAGVTASRDLGVQQVGEQPIATPFITGQQSAITNRAATQMGALTAQGLPLQQQLARAQALRQSAMDVSKERLTYAQGQDKAANDYAQSQYNRNTLTASEQARLAFDREKLTSDRAIEGMSAQTNAQKLAFDQNLATQKFNQDVKEFGLQYALSKQKAASEGSDPSSSKGYAYQAERAYRTLQSVNELSTKARTNSNIFGRSAALPLPDFLRTDAYRNFRAELDTLKSSITFGELTAMREASKTGGALGQVSDVENRLLSASLGALEMSQSSENFQQQLVKIRESIQRWQAAVSASSGTKSGSTYNGIQLPN